MQVITSVRAHATSVIKEVTDSLYRNITGFDHRNRWFGAGRSALALGPIITLVFTPIRALVVPVGPSPEVRCDGVRAVSLLCVGGPGSHLELRRWLLVALFAVVLVGFLPRWTAILHVWGAYTMSVSLTLPDGGEAIGLIIALLILPMALADDRRWHWQAPSTSVGVLWQPIAYVASIAVRTQVAFIYLDSGIAKMGVRDWANGTAEYYILRDPQFGVAGPLHHVSLWVSNFSLGTLVLTWGGIVIEIAIGVCLLASHRWRAVAWFMDVFLHISIILTIGLFSFAVLMMGAATVAANPVDVVRRRWNRNGHGATRAGKEEIAQPLVAASG